MSLIKRIRSSVTASLDTVVRKVENHDAIIEVALQETRQAATRARVRLARVQKDGAGLKTRARQLDNDVQRWAERATSVARDDNDKALACLRRRNECRSQLAGLQQAIVKHDELEKQIGDNVKRIDARVSEVAQQRNMMRSRQSVAEAARVVNNIDGVSFGEVEETFDRWEINLGETEIMFGGAAAGDALAASFERDEDEATLRAELDELLRANEETG